MGTMALYTDSSLSNDGLVKSRMEHGRYVNSFNPEFKMPGFGTILRWVFGAPNNTRLPADVEELNKLLPVLKPKPDEIWKTTPGLRFIWIGHATCLVQMDDFMFLTDPVFSERCGVTPQVGPKRYRPPALTVEDLPDKLEAIVISHNHFDHLDYPSVTSLNERYGKALTWFCGRGLRQWFLNCHIQNVVELDWWEEWKHPVC
jgi:N-acyl-phosphatidylethanolamine-hydrolysing phospholipase D